TAASGARSLWLAAFTPRRCSALKDILSWDPVSETCLLLTAPITSERLMGIKETHYRICLQCDKASHLGKKLLLPGLLNGMLYEMDVKDHRKVTVKLSKRWDGPFKEETSRHS
ncbi:hypothetical protein LEMLEM_LOCUS574, partial [Lemmus lemmus]